MNLDFLQTSSFQKIEEKAFELAQHIFPCEKEFIDSIPMEKIISELQKNLKSSNHPFLIRTVGQSGSGKSSQLIPALQNVLQENTYIRISVGMFAIFHPRYEFLKKNNPNKLREETNGFALRALILFYKHCREKTDGIPNSGKTPPYHSFLRKQKSSSPGAYEPH